MAVLSSSATRLRVLALLASALWLFAVAAAVAQPNAGGATLESIRLTVDRVETSLGRDSRSTVELVELGRTLSPVRDQLRERIAAMERDLAQVQARLTQLGAPPAAGAPAEPAELAAERAQLSAEVARLDAAIKQARLLAVRAEQLGQLITERRYAAYARELFTRSASILDPAFWAQAVEAFAQDVETVAALVGAWWYGTVVPASIPRLVGAVLTLAVVLAAAVALFLRWRRWIAASVPASRLARASRALWAVLRTAAFEPLVALILVQVLELYGLLPVHLRDLAGGFVVAVAIGAFGHGVATGLFAPREPERRLIALDEHTAQTLARHLAAAARLMALFVFLDVAQRMVLSPPVLIALASMLYALAIVVLLVHLLVRLRAIEESRDGVRPVDLTWLRSIGWLMAALIVIALLAGYARLADFLAERLIVAVLVLGLVYLLAVGVDALFTETFTADSMRGRAVAASLGLPPRRMALVGALLSGAIRLALLLLAVVFVIGPSETTATDLVGTLRALPFVITVGEAQISLQAVFAAFVVLAVGIVLTRGAKRWLDTEILPRTELESSLRLSVGMIFGYVGIIATISLALAALGIDLQKIALVAGALSVGIGFGLQSIVSNFVSGLILLTERPIRVGDWIVAKGEEGFVRRIRVRATEVETFDRASVIIPNSDLISGVVKNWTHADLLGRITVKVGVSYDSDPEAVRDVLLAVAAEHPAVLRDPPPRVFFMAFGDSALEFELRCIVNDVQQALRVRSELNFAVLAQFRRAGIQIPFPQRDVHIVTEARPAAPPTGRHERA